MITKEEYEKALKTKDDILSGNKARYKELQDRQIELSKMMKAKAIEPQDFQNQMNNIRGEMAEIKRRNFLLVEEWIKVDCEYKYEAHKAPTLDDLKDKLAGEKIDLEKWRLQ